MTRTWLAGMACAGILLAGAAPAQDCETSQWGEGDELGSANLVTPERTLEAAKLIKQGKSMPLGIVIDSETPAFAPRSLNLQVVQPNQQGGQKLEAFGYPGNYNDDILQTWVGIGSQIDGLGHLTQNGMSHTGDFEYWHEIEYTHPYGTRHTRISGLLPLHKPFSAC